MKCNPDEKDSLNIAGRIHYACGENERALEFYDASIQNEISFSSSDLRNYIFLLKDQKRYKDCLAQLEKHFEECPYFYGLGQLASEVYESNCMYFESVLCAWMDLEYLGAFNSNVSVEKFLDKINSMGRECRDFRKARELKLAANAVESFSKGASIVPPEIESDFFIWNYIKSKCQLGDNGNYKNALETYISLEKYFCSFPQYYFYLAEFSRDNKVLEDDSLEILYETIIKMKPESEYTVKAKVALTELWNVGGNL